MMDMAIGADVEIMIRQADVADTNSVQLTNASE
jgi:hypothetical protein